jgi:hypothetical protein
VSTEGVPVPQRDYRTGHVRVGMTCVFHEPRSGQVCAAIIANVHQPRCNGMPNVNLAVFDNNGEPYLNGFKDVPWGPGVMGSWWFPDEQ